MLQQYQMTVMPIKLRIKDLQEFVEIVEQMKNGIVTVSQGTSTISGKSLINLLSLDFTKPQTLIIQGEFDNRFIEQLKKWEYIKR